MGPKRLFPYSSGLESSRHSHMRELRIKSHGDPLRIFYAFDPTPSATQGLRALRRTPQDPAIPIQATSRSFSALTKVLIPEPRERIEQRKRQEIT